MSMNNYKESNKKTHKQVVRLCIIAFILTACYFVYYKYEQSKINFQPVGFSVEVNTKELPEMGTKWLAAYTEQFKGRFVPKRQKLVEHSVDNIEIKDTNVIQIDFSIVTKKLDERNAASWNGVLAENKIKCQWVLWFKEEETPEGNIIYTVTKYQRPAGYDLEKYNASGEKERDQYKQQYENEIPHEDQQYTYKIKNKICYVTYDKGSTWKEVPVPLETLVAVGDGRESFNTLQEQSYVITPEKTAFVYGGTREIPFMITYSSDMGATWKTSEISKSIDSARVKFCSFPTTSVGYVILTGGRVMSQEGQVIYKTIDGGSTWKEVGTGPSSQLLKSGGFVGENLGFMSYPKVQGAKTNFYRTEDGGKTFEPVILPSIKQEWMGFTSEPFIQPETPYMEGDQLFLLIGQGEQGDFKGGNIKAKCKSNDGGRTWIFVELFEPPSKEQG